MSNINVKYAKDVTKKDYVLWCIISQMWSILIAREYIKKNKYKKIDSNLKDNFRNNLKILNFNLKILGILASIFQIIKYGDNLCQKIKIIF